jgi:hypothetical protein
MPGILCYPFQRLTTEVVQKITQSKVNKVTRKVDPKIPGKLHYNFDRLTIFTKE